MIAYAPAVAIILAVVVIEVGLDGPGSGAGTWLPLVEVSAILGGILAGALWYGWRQARAAARVMTALNDAEEQRRIISAIGVGSNWDLDINRIFARFSNDLTALIDYDRLTIVTARSDGQMRLEFVAGLQAPEDDIDGIVVSIVGSPDGLLNPTDYGLHSQLTVPIAVIDGTVTIRNRDRNAYTPGHVEIMRQVVAQVSPGISNAIHYRESQQLVMERTALAEIGRVATQEVDLDSILMVVSGTLANLIQFNHIGLILTDPDGGQATIACWSTEDLLGLKVGDKVDLDGAHNITGVMAGRGNDPLGLSADGGIGADEQRLWMQVPLGEKSNLLGVIVISAQADAVLGEDEADLLQRVADQIAPAIKNAQLTTELTRAVEERRVIAAIGHAASTEFDMERIFAVVADQLETIMPCDRFVATITEPGSKYVEIVYVRGVERGASGVGDRIIDLTDDERRELNSRHAILRNRLDSFVPASPTDHHSGMLSWVQVALGDLTDPMGYLSLHSKDPDAYDMTHVEFLEGVARQITPPLRNARIFAREHELRDQLDVQNKELQEATATKSRFLSTVSHELKTPLTIISGFTDLMIDAKDQFSEEHVESLEIVRKNITQLGLLINDVLDVSQIDAGHLRIEPTVFQFNELVRELARGFEQLLVTKNQKLTVSVPDSPVWLEADRNRVSQLITNLLSNAHKYSGDDCEIRLNVAVEGENIAVLVEDEGIGISADDQEQLFTAFFRADNLVARQVGGTGLGLIIAKSIAELHGGELWLNSVENRGTTVGFRLPGITSKPEVDPSTGAELPVIARRSRLYPDKDWDDIGETA
ncbi:MAG: ATP-binding protein [Chloroflexi bacterium]|nr:ATP-binding protein [Chloroflexota bacterium]